MCVACSTYDKQLMWHPSVQYSLSGVKHVCNGYLFTVNENLVFLYVNKCTTSISEKYKFASSALRNLIQGVTGGTDQTSGECSLC